MVEGAETTLYATLSPELKDSSGIYLEDSAPMEPSKRAQDIDDQDRLWEITIKTLSRWMTTDLSQNKKSS